MIYVDTSFFFPLFYEKDKDHERVRVVFESLAGRRLPEMLLTCNHVVFETITLTRLEAGHAEAVKVAHGLLSERIARIHWATPEEEREAIAFLERYRDKEYSAVDCLGFTLMKRLGIEEAWAVDRDFTHHGFTVRPGPRPRKR